MDMSKKVGITVGMISQYDVMELVSIAKEWGVDYRFEGCLTSVSQEPRRILRVNNSKYIYWEAMHQGRKVTVCALATLIKSDLQMALDDSKNPEFVPTSIVEAMLTAEERLMYMTFRLVEINETISGIRRTLQRVLESDSHS